MENNEEKNPSYTFVETDRQGWVLNNESGEFTAAFSGFDLKATIDSRKIESLEEVHEAAEIVAKGILQMFLDAYVQSAEEVENNNLEDDE